jgi:outer membrane protein TolC
MERFGWGRWGAALALIAAPGFGFSQQPTLTLRQAIDRALGENPQTAIAHADAAAADAQIGTARTGLLPRLNFTEDLSRGDDPVYVFGTKLRQQQFTENDFSLDSLNRPTPIGNFATRFNGSWTLFNGLETERQIRGAKLAAGSADAMAEQVNQGVVLEVVQAYQGILYARREIEVALHEEQTAEALLHEAQSRVKAGLAVDSDLLAAQVNLAEREQEHIAAEGEMQNAWSELETAMGGAETPRPELKPIEAKSFPEGVLADDIAGALKARPDLRALRQQTAARQEAVKAAKADFLPQIAAYGNWEMDRQSFAGNGGDNWVAGVQLNLDILPLGKRSRLAQEQAAKQKAEAQDRADELQICLAVNRAWTAHETAERMVETARASMAQSAEGLRILRNRYDAGLATITDLLRAEDAQRQSQNDYWRTAYGNTVAYAELLYATGNLTPESAENLQ